MELWPQGKCEHLDLCKVREGEATFLGISQRRPRSIQLALPLKV